MAKSKVAALWGIILCALVFLAGCKDQPYTEPVIIAALGDSLTAGFGLPASNAFPAKLEQRFHEQGYSGVKILNYGISGDTTQGGLNRLKTVLAAKPDIVIVELGANDLLRQRPPDQARKNLSAIVTQLKAANIRVILAGVEPPRVYALGNQYVGQYLSLFADIADEQEVAFYPDFLNGVQGKASLNLDDRLHPNANGVEVIVENIFPTVEGVVRAHVEGKSP